MSDEIQQPQQPKPTAEAASSASSGHEAPLENHVQPVRQDPRGVRYSLKEMMEEVVMERRESVFGRELVDSTEIEKMFGKKKRKSKKS